MRRRNGRRARCRNRRHFILTEHDAAAGRLNQPGDATRHRRFAGARFADDAQGLPAPQLQRHVGGGLHGARALEPALVDIGLGEFFGLQHDRPAGVDVAVARMDRGHGGDQHAGVVVFRPRQQFGLGLHFHQGAGLEHGDPIGDLGDHAEVVGDEQHAGAVIALQVADQLEDLRLGGDVQRSGRLVGDQQRRFENQRDGDDDALALPAGELVGVRGHHAPGVRQAHFLDRPEHPCKAFRLGQPGVLAQHFVDLVAAAHHRIERGHRLLENHRHAGAAQGAQTFRGGRQHILALQQNFSCRRPQCLGQQTHHRVRDHGFSRTRFANQAHHLA